MTTREPEWDTEQVDLMLAWDAYRRDIGPHGQLMSEATNDAANPNNYDGGYRYVAHGPFTDWAKKAELDREDAYKKEAGKDANLNGMYFTVQKVVD